MDETGVVRLVPAPAAEMPLRGLYLGEALPERRAQERVFVYSNFVASLDGRISVARDDAAPARGVPDSLANPRDWRLYQELAIQADVIITSGRYVRERVAGTEGPILTYPNDPAMSDLVGWRTRRGLPAQPALAVVSRSLEFDERAAMDLAGDVVAVGAAATSPERVERLEEKGIRTVLGESADGVSGAEIATGLGKLGYHTAFSAAGPMVLHLFLESGVLDLLYVTQVLKLLGGRSYATLDEGALLTPPATMDLRALYADFTGTGDAAQLFAALEARA